MVQKQFLVEHWGLIAYDQALVRMNDCRHQVSLSGQGILVFAHHPPVITLGKHSDQNFILCSDVFRLEHGISLHRTDRGGQVTVHVPGQLMIYPIFPLGSLAVMPKEFVWRLEEAMINTLLEFGLTSHRRDGAPGLWVHESKICAIGVRISQRVSSHGLALNVKGSLDWKTWVVPCGLKGFDVTSLEAQTREGSVPEYSVIETTFAHHLAKLFF